jgi:alpha-beta hydrolase superfamily lysophospholipase
MIRFLVRHFGTFVGYSLLGGVVVLVLGFKLRLDAMPELSVWHTAVLDSEFRADDAVRVRNLDDYRALEERLFAELDAEVYDRVNREERRALNRFARGSIADPSAQPVDGNRTFELSATDARGAVLLLHGLSDSPYSMRALGERLNARGFHVVGLRLPGHGTAPAGLRDVHWQDFAAAIRLAARDLARRTGSGKPLHIVGYSMGAALAVEYALSREQGEDLPAVTRMALLSPAIGVSPAAGLAVWQKRAGQLLGVGKLAWTEIVPEYDPYKYNSFTANAGEQMHAITRSIAERLDRAAGSGAPADFPRILAFQSVADATVSTSALIAAYFRSVVPGRHELVLFDINRHADAAAMYLPGVADVRPQLLSGPPLPFDLTIVANVNEQTGRLAAVHRRAASGEVAEQDTDLAWPSGVFSLSHVALPFAPDDPVYGSRRPSSRERIYLGAVDARGERGVLAASPANLIRLRHNPFFEFMAQRIEQFLLAE